MTEDPAKNSNLRVSTLRFCFRFSQCVLFPLCVFPMDPLLRPEYLLHLLEQGARSLEGHARLFLVLPNLSSYPDGALCAFYDASLNSSYRSQSSEDGPRADFAYFVQCSAHHLPAVWSECPSPSLMESRSSPRPTSHRRMERQS